MSNCCEFCKYWLPEHRHRCEKCKAKKSGVKE